MTGSLAAAGRILVRLPNWLGDTLMARPFLHALRRAAPRARVMVLGPGGVLPLLAGEGVFDDALAWPPGDALGGLRHPRVDVAFVLPPSFSSAWFAWRLGARERIGLRGDGRAWWLTRAVPRPARGERHLAGEFLSLLGPFAGPVPVPPVLVPPRDAVEEAGELEAREGLADRPLAILAPGALYGPAKRWPLERFAAVARALAARGCAVIACGGAPEREACDGLAAASGGVVRSLAGRTSLGVLAALCARAGAVVSNDSGLAHLAAATGAPTVAVFGSTSSAWTAPLGPRVRIVQRPPVCSPCFRRTCAIGYACLHAVPVVDVLRALDALAPAARERSA